MNNYTILGYSKRIKKCDNVIKELKRVGLEFNIKEKKRVKCSSTDCWLETGCEINFKNSGRDKIIETWTPISIKNGFNESFIYAK